MKMEWSADAAMREMWQQLPSAARTTNGDMMLFFKAHLQMAFDAGRNQEADARREHVLKQPAN
jgi:hypothetical protein